MKPETLTIWLSTESWLTPALGQRYSTACPDHFPVGRFRGVSWVQRACSKVVPRPRAPSEVRALGQDSVASADLCGGLWDTLVVVPQQMPKYKSKCSEEGKFLPPVLLWPLGAMTRDLRLSESTSKPRSLQPPQSPFLATARKKPWVLDQWDYFSKILNISFE